MGNKWSNDQIQFMRGHYGTMTVDEFRERNAEQQPASNPARGAF